MKLNDRGRAKIKEALEKKMIKALRRSKELAPVDTGRLRSSITYVDISGNNTIGFALGTNVEYADDQEFGNRFMAPNPFLRPALREQFSNFR
jgi:HK97 gp10 family phage protein